MKTTKAHFKTFKQECDKWIKYFGLLEFRVVYRHQDIGNAEANVTYNTDQMCAKISLNTSMSKHLTTDAELKGAAFHEVCHILLAKFYDAASNRSTTESELDSTEHALVQKLINLIHKPTLNIKN